MKVGKVISAMTAYSEGNIHDVEHFLKVYGYAKAIGECEGLDSKTQLILEIAAIVHDIGIPKARVVYNSTAGKYQEELGPYEARELLEPLGVPQDIIDRVCFLVGHHHTYTDVRGSDYRILLEADFLVNAAEGKMSRSTIQTAKDSFFRTKTGMRILDDNFGV